jgi:uncharacterized membrane protein
MAVRLSEVAVWVAAVFEIIGVLIIVGGFPLAVLRGFQARRRTGAEGTYVTLRNIFGRAVLLGLEVLVAADLLRTITVAPTLDNLLALGLLVLIRTFLSWSFEVELEGVWPWRKREMDRRDADASRSACTEVSSERPGA